MKQDKTNAMRTLERAKITYEAVWLSEERSFEEQLFERAAVTFKTLVAQGASREHLVFVIPLSKTLDLKKAARAAGEKSVAMIPQKELLPLTGYIHGGCSPVGMKKPLKSFIDLSAETMPLFFVSAGRVGVQMGVEPRALGSLIGARFCELCAED